MALPPAPIPPPALNVPIYAPTPPPGPWELYVPKHPGMYNPTPTGLVYAGPGPKGNLAAIAATLRRQGKRGFVIGERQLAYSMLLTCGDGNEVYYLNVGVLSLPDYLISLYLPMAKCMFETHE